MKFVDDDDDDDLLTKNEYSAMNMNESAMILSAFENRLRAGLV